MPNACPNTRITVLNHVSAVTHTTQIFRSQKANFQLDFNHFHLKILPRSHEIKNTWRVSYQHETYSLEPMKNKFHLRRFFRSTCTRTCPHGHPRKLKSRGSQSSGKMLKSAELYLWLSTVPPDNSKFTFQNVLPTNLSLRTAALSLSSIIQFCSLFNLIVKSFPSSMQSTFSKHSSKPLLLSAILNLYDENLTSLLLVGL